MQTLLQHSSLSGTYFLKIVLLASTFSLPILRFSHNSLSSRKTFPSTNPNSEHLWKRFLVCTVKLFIHLCIECLAKLSWFWNGKNARFSTVEPPFVKATKVEKVEKWRQILYPFYRLWKTNTAIIYLKHVKKKKQKTPSHLLQISQLSSTQKLPHGYF